MMRYLASISTLLLCLCGTLCAQAVRPPGVTIPEGARPAPVPDYFMLALTDPGCDPDEDCDDVGTKKVYRNWYIEQTGCNWGAIGFSWSACEKVRGKYNFASIRISEHDRKMKFKVGHIGCGGANWINDPKQGIGPEWAEKDEFKFEIGPDGKKRVSDRYWKAYENFVAAACRYVRGRFGITIFETGGNERDLVARDTYKEFYRDWHFYYMAPVVHAHAGMKRAHKDNKLIIGNLCYTTKNHVGALYDAGAKDKYEILSLHAYGKTGVHLDMWQIIEAHNAMAARGDDDIGIVLIEGWSCFPLPDRIDKDPILRRGAREYTEEDNEHYRQTVLDGWRNLMTPRKDEYDPKWVVGARYFVLNDHWGGRLWEQRSKAEYDEQGNLKGFHLDGYFIGTSDPNWIKPFLRPWGLIDIEGKPKGDIVFNFPPYLPKHDFEVTFEQPLKDKTVTAGQEYRLIVKFTNREDSPMTDFRMEMVGRDDPAKKVKYRFLGGDETTTISPGQTITRRYAAVYPPELAGEDTYRARGFADAHYTWRSRPYHTDAWMPRVTITQPVSLEVGDGDETSSSPSR